MTALREYQRLEAPARWRPDAEASYANVFVSIGHATLTISDPAEGALTHWSLAAVERQNPGGRPARFAPGLDSPERLEIDEEEMVDAIERVRRAVARRRRHPGRLRALLIAGGVAAVFLLGLLLAPEALIRNAAGVVPPSQRAAIGERLARAVAETAGPVCRSRLGLRALDRLARRALGDRGAAVVLAGPLPAPLALPGGTVLIDRARLDEAAGPEALAGHLLAADEAARALDPLAAMLRAEGSGLAARLLVTGDIPSDAVARQARRLLEAPPPPPADDALLARFAAAGVPSTPYALARDPSGETVLPLIEADPGRPEGRPPILADGDWIALQGICAE